MALRAATGGSLGKRLALESEALTDVILKLLEPLFFAVLSQ